MPEIRDIGVEITQILANAAAAPAVGDLPQAIVGIARRVGTKKTAGGPYTGLALTVAFPGLASTDELDVTTKPPKVYATNEFGEVDLAYNSTTAGDFDGAGTAGAKKATFGIDTDKTQFLLAANSIFTRVSQASSATGVLTRLADAGGVQVYKIVDAKASFQSGQTQPIAAPAGLAAYVNLESDGDGTVMRTITASTGWVSETEVRFTTAVGAGPFVDGLAEGASRSIAYRVLTEEPLAGRATTGLTGADLTVTYRAMRTDLTAAVKEITGAAEAELVLGAPHEDNPLGYAGAAVAGANPTRTFYALGVEEDTAAKHTVALDLLATQEVYFICPISVAKTVNDVYIAHANTLSLPAERHERVALICEATPEYVVKSTMGAAAVARTGLVLTITGATFLADGVVPGDLLEYTDTVPDPDVVCRVRIVAVNSQTVLVVDATTTVAGVTFTSTFPIASGASGTINLVVRTPDLDAAAKARILRTRATSIKSRRVQFLVPSTVTTNVAGVEIAGSGQYMPAIVGAVYASKEPGVPISRVGLPFVTDVSGSDSLFVPSQLRALTSDGVAVIIQPTGASLGVMRHEVSTDTSTKQIQQFSFTHVVDAMALSLRKTLDPLLGSSRMDEPFMTKFNLSVAAFFEYQKLRRRITAYDIQKLGPSATIEDAIEIVVRLTVPPVANNVDVTFIL